MLMWKYAARGVATLAAMGLLAACGSGKPSGQVVATVGGQEITAAELRLEIAQVPPDQVDPAKVPQQALQRIIARKLLAREAARRGIEKTPVGATQIQRSREIALIQLLQSKLNSQAPLDTSEAAINRFIDAHPGQFADRRLIVADQLVVLTNDTTLAPQLQSLGNLPAIEGYLTHNNIGFIRSATALDTASMVPNAATRIAGLQPDAIYVSPNGRGTLRVLRIASSLSQPLIGDDARNAALRLMDYARAQAAFDAIQKIIVNGKSRIWIDPAFLKG
jgi:peptidyl-prolyl cis-trans isomerase C